jgi:hypothetical protein
MHRRNFLKRIATLPLALWAGHRALAAGKGSTSADIVALQNGWKALLARTPTWPRAPSR